ncbi:MAG: tRNA modification GTPase [Proteobacteria bacterium]|nr:tRNA modification GTPase [Pseudomonadota bacterium]MCP4917105.1 tRNA modification GTPase [Pseudomonadota bacterium]
MIVASASAWGRSAVALVRLSGEGVVALVQTFARLRGGWPPARRARLGELFDADGTFDEALVTWFPGPRSYTGEDVVEIGCHGNPLLVERLLAAAVGAGARIAEPGEFTRRAFLNGRVDLTRAEAVMQAIEASSAAGLAIARQGLGGAVGGLADGLRVQIIEAVAELEARLDHPDGDLSYEDDAALGARLHVLGRRAQAAADTYSTGRILVEGARVALVGPVNAGKSSLFNALGGSERALVSEIPGTTRDVVERQVRLGSVSVTLLDTAGQREAQGLEAAGIELGKRLVADADLRVVVVPAHDPFVVDAPDPKLLVTNHADRGPVLAGSLGTVATRGRGVPELATAIAEALVGEEPGSAGLIIASQRQRDLLVGIAEACASSAEALAGEAGPAVAAEELYGALERLDALTGRDTREEVLDSLFSRFCIGK